MKSPGTVMKWTINQPHQLSAPVNFSRPLYHKSEFPPKTGVLESVPSWGGDPAVCGPRRPVMIGPLECLEPPEQRLPSYQRSPELPFSADLRLWVASSSSGSLAPIRAVHWWILTLRTRLGGLFKTLYCYNTSSSPQLRLEANSPAIFYFDFDFRGSKISNYWP